MKVRGAALLLLLATAGCKSARNNPPSFTGVWNITSPASAAGASLDLRANGKFVAARLPTELLEDAGPFSEESLSGSGEWELKRGGDSNRVMLKFQKMEAADHPPLPYNAELFFDESGQGLQLYFQSGDPDEDERTVLRRADEDLK